MAGFLRAIIAEAIYAGVDEPHFKDGVRATFDDSDQSTPVPYKKVRNIVYRTIYSAPVVLRPVDNE